jgi:hypothetical protein
MKTKVQMNLSLKPFIPGIIKSSTVGIPSAKAVRHTYFFKPLISSFSCFSEKGCLAEESQCSTQLMADMQGKTSGFPITPIFTQPGSMQREVEGRGLGNG